MIGCDDYDEEFNKNDCVLSIRFDVAVSFGLWVSLCFCKTTVTEIINWMFSSIVSASVVASLPRVFLILFLYGIDLLSLFFSVECYYLRQGNYVFGNEICVTS